MTVRGSVTARVATALLVALLASGCDRGEPPADVAAQIDGADIPYAEFEVYLAANAIVDAPSLGSEVLSGLFDRFLGELLLTRLAADEGFEAQTASGAVARLVSEAVAPVGRGEVEAYYRDNPEKFLEPERVRVHQILVQDRATAEAAFERLASGAGFEEVARELSKGPRAQRGGDQGLLSREDLPPEIASQIFELATGEVSEIIPAEYGFHIFRISERRQRSRIELESAVARIAEELQEQNRARTIEDLLQQAVRRYNMRLYARNLPFRYQGSYGRNT